jgi:hypothetical protein
MVSIATGLKQLGGVRCNTPQRIVKIGGPNCIKGALELRNVFNIIEIFLKIEVQGLKNYIRKMFWGVLFSLTSPTPFPEKNLPKTG